MNFNILIGKTVLSYKFTIDEIELFCDDGYRYILYHEQDCCESVTVDDVEGDLNSLLNVPILKAEETSNHGETTNYGDSSTWTFYKLATIKGYITIKWFGTSNGYYSESVDFKRSGPFLDELRDFKINQILD
jgi:hypothetical protein